MEFRRILTIIGMLSLSVILNVGGTWSGSGGLVATGSERAPAPPAAEIRDDDMVLASLLERGVPNESTLRVDVAWEERKASLSRHDRRTRVGVARSVEVQIDLSSLRPDDLTRTPRPLSIGAIRSHSSGGFTWSGVVDSPDAAALRLRFTNFFLPRNGELYLYSDQGEVAGPYTSRGPNGDGEFWSHTLRGSSLTIQLAYDGADSERALRATRFVVADVAHLDYRFALALQGPAADPQAGEGLCPGNAACIENAQCSTLDPAIDPARDAVAMILFASRSGPVTGLFVCSGGLINDTDPGSVVPYFLTANHCINKNSEASSVEAFFHYDVPCNGSCSGIPAVSSTLGASIVRTGRTGDYTLLELSEPPPAGTLLLGWNTSPVASTNGTSLYRISHPAASPQAYSEHAVDTDRPTCRTWPRGSWIYSADTFGGTEGGSSGSPVLNSAGQIVGQLSGACGFNVGDSCDAVENATVDGAFAAYFSEVSQYLDPNTSCTDADNDGFCVESGDCDDTDPAVNTGAAEICDDGADNDCDGLLDGADPACQTGSCDLLPLGDPCGSNTECCSAKCKGRPGNQTCR